MEDTQRLPHYPSHAIQRNYPEQQPEPGTRTQTGGQTTRMGSRTNLTCQATPASGPVPDQVEGLF